MQSIEILIKKMMSIQIVVHTIEETSTVDPQMAIR